MIKDCHVGIKGIVCVGDKCLVLQKGAGDESFWEVPGGRIDGEETIEATLTRELKEELPSIGNFSIGDIVGAYRLHIDIEGERGLVLIFYKVDAENFEVVLSSEHTDYKWVTKESLSELKNPEVTIKPELYRFLEKVLG
jgi:8-oxo-dGTP pyrophosphatase MutT (NUDIX family)